MEFDLARHWTLDPEVVFLNHGSFGACPAPVLAEQARLRAQMEREPVVFLWRELEARLDRARAALASFVGADPADLARVPNATAGVNMVVRSFPLSAGDEVLVTDHEYNACRNAVDEAAARAGARVVVVSVPFPIDSADSVVEAFVSRAGPRSRLALIDHVTSPTALVLPVKRVAEALAERGVATVVDGAHAPGMLPLADRMRIEDLGAVAYAGNCHKWLCAPKGAAFLWVRRDVQPLIRPLVTSHGANSTRTDRSRFLLESDWTGTDDPTPFLCIPAAIDFLGCLLPGGWPALMERNRALALQARDMLCQRLSVPPPCPDSMIGSMASVPLPDRRASEIARVPHVDPLADALWERERIEVPVMPWPAPPRRLVRVSAQAYNDTDDYERLVTGLVAALGAAGA